MKRVALLCALVFLASVAFCQDTPKVAVFGGYQFTSFDGKGGAPELGIGNRQSLNGFNADVAFRAAKNLSVVADFGAGFKTMGISYQGTNLDVKMKLYPILFGPRFSATKGKVTPFVETLFGVAHLNLGASAQGVTASQSYNKFALAFGGGVDVKVAKQVAVRVAKFDYLLVHFTDNTGGVNISENLNNLRVATGVVFTF